MSWFKKSSWSYVEGLLNNLLRTFHIISRSKDQYAVSLLPELIKAYNNLDRSRINNQPGSKELTTDLSEASRVLRLIDTKIEEIKVNPVSSGIKDLSQKGNWYNWENSGGHNNISVIPSSNAAYPPEIKLEGFKLGDSSTAEKIKQSMGEWIRVEEVKDPNPKSISTTYNMYIRGTQEAWKKFLGFAPYIFEDHELLTKLRFSKKQGIANGLPSERDFNPGYLEPEDSIDSTNKVLQVYPLNMDNENSVSAPFPGTKKDPEVSKPGIRLIFSPEDKTYPLIRDYLYNGEGLTKNLGPGSFDPRLVRVDWDNAVFDIFDIVSARWSALSNKLNYLGYSTSELNQLIPLLTGKTIGIASREMANKNRKKEEAPSETVIEGRIKKNLFGGARIGERFGVKAGEVISEEQFNNIVTENYPGVFGPTVHETQKSQQRKGIYFAASRTASILADEPGSGKTPMAIVAADIVRNENQKILVITPNMLVRENWLAEHTMPDKSIRREAKAPAKFAGHSEKNIFICKEASDLNNAISNPESIWIVIPLSVFSRSGQKSDEFVKTISGLSKSGVFSSMIFDEIQTIKNEDGVSFKKILSAISPYHIPTRIGLTGTPSDDNPENIWSQMMLLRHPVLFENKGIENWSLSNKFRDQKGFADAFLGGTELAKSVNIKKHEKDSMSDDEQDELKAILWEDKAKEVIKWVTSLSPERKVQILDLFSTTYLRRNKEDIRPDIPAKKRNIIEIASDSSSNLQGETNWHTKELIRLAKIKVPHTIKRSLQVLQNLQQKLFIVTKHPDLAEEISAGINTYLGDGTCMAVHGGIDEDNRTVISESFKNKELTIVPGKKKPLRAVVYTMQLGAVGLNFQIADRAIFNDMDWNPSDNLQAEYRVHRIDSQNQVNIDYMIIGNSYDSEMYGRVIKKQKINDNISNLIRAANSINPEEKLEVANKFIKNMVHSVIIDSGIKKEKLQEFEKIIDIALRGIDPYRSEGIKLRNQPQGVPVAANNWYAKLKTGRYEIVIV